MPGTGDEWTVMRVDRTERPSSAAWTCVACGIFPEWVNIRVVFDARQDDVSASRLTFRHLGLVSKLPCYQMCESGWDRYLPSLAAHVEGRGGSPWGSPPWRPARS